MITGDITLKIILAVLGSNALFTFIQFIISRYDNKHNKFDDLNDKIEDGLKENEEKDKNRYDEHQESIDKLNEAIEVLTKSNSEMQKYIYCIGDELTGLAHDTLVRLTDKYQRRGGITLKERATLDAIYIPYHDGLHGNGDGKTGYNYAMSLPTLSEEEARNLDAKIKYDEMKKVANEEGFVLYKDNPK